MNDRCIFCGRELTMLQRKKLHCGGTTQTLCGSCYEVYKKLPAVERAEAVLQTGRAEEADKIREFLVPIRAAREKREEEQKAKVHRRITDKQCLRCQGNMLDYGPVTFKLGEETYFFSDLNRFLSGSLTMELLRCESCGKVELFIPDTRELDALTAENA